ncbi:F-box domain-containing protein [Mycena indigotica]|uniref:F-box domain-containing protein n=1 Tax=Mycena indigotica TaxID=2126181 RepID=A0A8H6W2P0_9AGAR|nr:F-box domain-containing protein [Mycena indigotica]KAF7299463.1 F-box domain-containing protein [Mycena indigotica]
MRHSNSESYNRLLFPKRHGYALYNPRPTSARKGVGVEIGDVGVVTKDGQFDPYFNVLDNKLNKSLNVNIPPQFLVSVTSQDWATDVRDVRDFFPPKTTLYSLEERANNVGAGLRSENSRLGIPANIGADVHNKSHTNYKAILELPNGGSSYDYRALGKLEKHAMENAQDWYSYVSDKLGRSIAYGDLYLVTGVQKAASWRRTFGRHSETASGVRANAEILTGALGIGGEQQRKTEENDSVNYYPHSGEPVDVPKEDQTVFFSGFKIMVRINLQGRVVGRLRKIDDDYKAVLPRATSCWSPFVSCWSSLARFFQWCLCCGKRSKEVAVAAPVDSEQPPVIHPILSKTPNEDHISNAFNAYILKTNENANVAMIHDALWPELLEDGEEMSDEVLFERAVEKFKVGDQRDGRFSVRLKDGPSLEQLVEQQISAEGEIPGQTPQKPNVAATIENDDSPEAKVGDPHSPTPPNEDSNDDPASLVSPPSSHDASPPNEGSPTSVSSPVSDGQDGFDASEKLPVPYTGGPENSLLPPFDVASQTNISAEATIVAPTGPAESPSPENPWDHFVHNHHNRQTSMDDAPLNAPRKPDDEIMRSNDYTT